jgi:hypothetical protein
MKATINQIPKRNAVKLDRQRGIYNNGLDNAYPQRIERIINSSVTAKASADMLKKFLIGGGFVDDKLNNVVISSDIFGRVTLLKLHQQVSQTVSRQNAASLAIRYDKNYQITEVKHLPYRDVRFGKQDSNDYSGMIFYYNNWQKDPTINNGFKASDIAKINIFNPMPDVVKTQWEKEKNNYRGQIAVLRLDDEYIYPLSPVDAALEDCDTESQIKLFKNTELSKGFFAKYILWHTNFADESEQRAFKEVLQKFEGGDHASSIMMAEATFDAEGNMINDGGSFKLEKVEQNINDKLFESYEKSVANNIRKSFSSIPAILIEQQDGSFFGQSGQAFVEAFNFYNTQIAEIRNSISEWYKEIFKYSKDEYLRTADYTLKPLQYTKPQI